MALFACREPVDRTRGVGGPLPGASPVPSWAGGGGGTRGTGKVSARGPVPPGGRALSAAVPLWDWTKGCGRVLKAAGSGACLLRPSGYSSWFLRSQEATCEVAMLCRTLSCDLCIPALGDRALAPFSSGHMTRLVPAGQRRRTAVP